MFIHCVLLVGIFACTSTLPANSSLESVRIVNGTATDIEKIPYQASLKHREFATWSHRCGAVVISNRGFLTAGHCVDGISSPSSLRVDVGTSYRSTGGVEYVISKIIPHENFSSLTLLNDIALLVPVKTILFGTNVRPIRIAPLNINLTSGANALVSGYGAIEYLGQASSSLHSAKVTIVSQEACARAYRTIAAITSGMLCASGTNPPTDACQGDSGGPLVADGYLVGIVSWGEGCADLSYPGVYTRISMYSSWVESKSATIT